MKKKILITICTIFVLVISSCSGSFEESKKTNKELAAVSFVIGSTGARTMMPQFENDKLKTIRLLGEAADASGEYSGNPEVLGEWTSDSEKTSCQKLTSENINLSEGTWKFTINAYTDEEGYSFTGTVIKEITASEKNTVTFRLHITEIRPTAKEGGHFNAKFYIPDEVKSVTAGIYFGATDSLDSFAKNYIIGTPDANGIYKDENWYYGEMPLSIETDSTGRQYVDYSDSMYSAKNNGRTGLQNGAYEIWVKMFLDENEQITINGNLYDTWGGEYREYLWIADGITTSAERTLKLKYDGYLGGIDIKGAVPGMTLSLTYENGSSVDSLIPDSAKRKTGYKFTGFFDDDGNEVTVLDENTQGKTLHGFYYMTINIPKFIGQNGESDLIGKTWDNVYLNSTYGNLFEKPYSIMQDSNKHLFITHIIRNNDPEKLSADFIFDENCIILDGVTGEKKSSQTHYYWDDKNLDDGNGDKVCFSDLTQIENNSSSHIVAEDYLYSEGYSGTATDYTLKHSAAVLKFNLTGLPVDETFMKMVLYVPGERIRCEMQGIEYDQTESECKIIWEDENLAERYNHYFLKLGPNGTGMTPADDGTFTLYSILPPKDYSGKTIICTLVDQFDRNYVCYFDDGLNIEEGKLYPMNGTPVKIDREYCFKISNGGNNWRNTCVSVCNRGAYSPEDAGEFIGSNDTSLYVLSLSDLQRHYQAFLESPDITWTWGSSHGVKGCFATGIDYSSGENKSVFIPAYGWYVKDSSTSTIKRTYHGFGESCNYWIGTEVTETDYIYCMFGDEEDPGVMGYIDKGTELDEQRMFCYRNVTYDN